jgi:hypothetical protein
MVEDVNIFMCVGGEINSERMISGTVSWRIVVAASLVKGLEYLIE